MTEKSDEQKKPRLELKKTFDAGKIKQSFSHGRSRSVSVEVKKKRFFSEKNLVSSEESKEKNLIPEIDKCINKRIEYQLTINYRLTGVGEWVKLLIIIKKWAGERVKKNYY